MTKAQMIALAMSGAQALVAWIAKQIQTAKQNHELTPEEEAGFDAQLAALGRKVEWQPEQPPPPTP